MRRGSQRGRGRNPNPTRSASTRSNRSNRSNRSDPPSPSRTRPTHRGTALQRSYSHASLRRSARIAELLNGETNDRLATATSPMADVARPRALGGTSVRSRHHTRTPGRSRSNRHSPSPEDIRYAMDIVVQPPRSARVGQILPGSIIVRLRTTNADPEDAVADSANLVAVATLVPGPNSSTPADPAILNALLIGRRFDTIHPFADDEADGSIASMDMADPNGIGYMRFPDLVIRQTGTYRIRITLLRIRNSASDPPVSAVGNGLSIQVVDSNPVVVMGSGASQNVALYNGVGESHVDDGGWLDILRTIQEQRRSR